MMEASNSPMTKFWCMKIKSPDTANQPTSQFNALLREILEFCYSRSGHDKARHEFWEEDVDNPSQIVMITGFPTVESNVAADKEYISSDRLPRMAEWVESGRLIKCLENVELAPLDEGRLDFHIAYESKESDEGSVQWTGTELAQGKAVGQVQVLMTPRKQKESTAASSDGSQVMRMRKRLL